MKKIPDIINRLWNVCGQMEVGALLTCGSGINENKMHTKYSGFTVLICLQQGSTTYSQCVNTPVLGHMVRPFAEQFVVVTA